MYSLPAVTGRVYFTPCSPLTLLAVANTFYATPFLAPAGGASFDQIGLRVTTAGNGAGADVALAIYADLGGRPGKLINDCGAIVGLTSLAGFQVNLTPPLRLQAGVIYWLACVFNVAATTMPTVAAISAALPSQVVGPAFGVAAMGNLPNASASSTATGVSAAMAFGAFPIMAPTSAPAIGVATPLIGMRAA